MSERQVCLPVTRRSTCHPMPPQNVLGLCNHIVGLGQHQDHIPYSCAQVDQHDMVQQERLGAPPRG